MPSVEQFGLRIAALKLGSGSLSYKKSESLAVGASLNFFLQG